MNWGQTLTQAGWRTAAGALASTGLGIVVNLATSGDYSGWVWAGVAALTVVVFAVSLWQQHSTTSPALTPPPAPAVGIDLSDVETPEGMSADGVDATGTAVRVEKGRFGGKLEFKNIRAGHGDASHP